MMPLFFSVLFSWFAGPSPITVASTPDTNPEELGTVQWIRDFDQGIAEARKQDKPIFILFQEVPGCLTCRNYGKQVLSHPLVAEAIESLFIPVAIYNNKGGADAKVLSYYKEPSWNNPVVRIVDANKRNIVPRIGGDYSSLGVVQSMILALIQDEKEVPAWLTLLEKELKAQKTGTEKATFSMYCFWTGEKKLGQVEGVVKTRPGFMNGTEVVTVEYDPEIISYETLIKESQEQSIADRIYTENDAQKSIAGKIMGNSRISDRNKFRLDREPKYYLSKTIFQYLPMTELQATKVNSSIGEGKSPNQWLSQKQLALLEIIQTKPQKAWPSAIGVSIEDAWDKANQIMD